MNKIIVLSLAFLSAFATLARAAAQQPAVPDRETAAAAVKHYLSGHGDFCLGKMDWPVDISAIDERARGRDVIQMPVLESLGLVRSAMTTAMRVEGPGVDEDAAPAPVPVRRYELTPLAEKFVHERDIIVPGPAGERHVRRRDLCAAHLALADVVAVAPDAGSQGFVATYTYVAEPTPWATSAEFQRVFPMAARVIGGTRKMQLKQAFVWTDGAWAPAGLTD